MDWSTLVEPGLSGLAAWAATIAVIKTDIAWIKARIIDNKRAADHTANRLDRHIEKHDH